MSKVQHMYLEFAAGEINPHKLVVINFIGPHITILQNSQPTSRFIAMIATVTLLDISGMPSKDETFTQCRVIVGPASKTMGQHLHNLIALGQWQEI